MTDGARALLSTLATNGVEVCFANPGTSEMHAVAAFADTPGIRAALVLFEGVATGAADGYARMTGRPAATLLHLGPGLANGLSNLHNARRAGSPVVNVVGDHATGHRALDAPLTSDVEGTARPFSDWVRTSAGPGAVARDAADAVAASRAGRIATLVLPADAAWGPAPAVPWPVADPAPEPEIDAAAVEQAALLLARDGGRTAILFGGRSAGEGALDLAAAIGARTGAAVLTATHTGRVPRGAGRPAPVKVPYPPEQARALLDGVDTILLAGATPPVAFFAKPGMRGELTRPGTRFVHLCPPTADAGPVLAAVHDALGAPPLPARVPGTPAGAERPTGAITPEKLAAFLAGAIPENAVVVDESITTGRGFHAATAAAAPHDWLSGTGGSIGYALPVAIGAAVACPDRPVLVLESDGSGLYMPQALWTMAREGLDVVTLVFANRRYQILHDELAGIGAAAAGEQGRALLDLDAPAVDWVSLARGLGVPATRASTMEELAAATGAALAAGGPALVEVVL